MKLPGEQFAKLLTLPNLKRLDVNSVLSFRPVELPEMTNLTELKIDYYWENSDIPTFCNLLRKMPKLDNLKMSSLEMRRSSMSRHNGMVSDLLCQIAHVAAFQNRDVIVKNSEDRTDFYYREWKIERRNAESEANQQARIFNFVHTYGDNPDLGISQIFVKNVMRNFRLVTLVRGRQF